MKSDCGCSDKDDAFALMAKAAAFASGLQGKAGRTLSGRNTQRLQQASTLIQEVLSSGDVQGKTDDGYTIVDVTPETMFEVKELLDPIAEFYGADLVIDEKSGEFIMVSIKSDAQIAAMSNLVPFHEPTVMQTKALIEQLTTQSIARSEVGHGQPLDREGIEAKAASIGDVLTVDFSPKYQTWVVAVEGKDGKRWDTFWSEDGELQATNRICGITVDSDLT